MSDRIFSEDEVQRLIKRAAELEAERTVSGRGAGKNGLTIDELKIIASETGLDPELIEKAAAEMDIGLSNIKENVHVNRDEIVSEIWLERQPNRDTMDLLVTELNHIYGTTDELNWWENLWGTHEGKAKVKRTSNTTEWNYKTEAGIYSTRVLMQQRGDRFRIRVSKRQIFGMEWDNPINSMLLVIPIAIFMAIIGGFSSSTILGIEWPGIATGILLALLAYPLMRYITKRTLVKHKTEVKNTIRQLSEVVIQFTGLGKNKKRAADIHKSSVEIEFPNETEESESQFGKLRNSLRE